MDSVQRSCIDCRVQACATKKGSYPEFCPTQSMGEGVLEACAQSYDDDAFASKVMRTAARVSADAFAKRWCRVEETIAFFRDMGWVNIGIASCAGLNEEAILFARILRAQGFEPHGICCKVGSLPKARFNAPESCCDFGAVSCNPLMQAQLLNDAGTDVNVIMGLCVGHDILFNAQSNAPVTTLVVKDRALFHNPVGALYAAETSSFYNHLLKSENPCCS